MDIVNRLWYVPVFLTFAEILCKKCVICGTNSVSRGVTMPLSTSPKPEVPFEHLMMDLWYKYCLGIVYIISNGLSASHVNMPQLSL